MVCNLESPAIAIKRCFGMRQPHMPVASYLCYTVTHRAVKPFHLHAACIGLSSQDIQNSYQASLQKA